jgi:AcrR family transcriptional regulator
MPRNRPVLQTDRPVGIVRIVSPRNKVDGRQRLVDAAERLILGGGLGRLSVEAVIREAGLSKGAFFHHFGSRDDLLLAIISRLTGELEARIAQRTGSGPDSRGKRLRTQVEISFDAEPREKARLRALVLALIEAAISGPDFVKAARKDNEAELRANLQDDLPLGEALVVQFALDGYWLNECLGGVRLTAAQRTALRDCLLRLSEQPAPARPRKPSTTNRGQP